MKPASMISMIVICFLVISTAQAVDLSDQQVEYQSRTAEKNVLGKQWFDKIDISGTLATAYIQTDKNGGRPHGSFNNNQVIFWITTQVWENVEANIEWYAIKAYASVLGEAYVHFKDLFGGAFSLKAGRFDLPFGEEYLWQDFIDNPLILRTAAWPWAWSEGLMIYGNLGSLGWVASVTDGDFDAETGIKGLTDGADDDHPSKAINLKAYSQVTTNIYISASYMKNGKTGLSSMWFGNNKLMTPDLTRDCSTSNDCDKVDFDAVEIDFVYRMGEKFKFSTNYGIVNLDDDVDFYDRVFTYYMVQPQFYITDNLYLIARYSTFASDKEGAKFGTSSSAKTGDDGIFTHHKYRNLKLFSLTEVGLGYQPNFNTRIVLEYGFLNYEFAETNLDDEGRNFYGLKLATKF